MTLLNEPGAIAEGQRGHRRGVVLGFTMAELMLLLLFCLLLVSAGILLTKDEALTRQQEEITRLKALPNGNISTGELELLLSAEANLKLLLSLLFPDGVPPEVATGTLDELWMEVVLAKNQQTQLAEAAREANGGKELTQEQLDALIRALESLVAGGLANVTPELLDVLRAAGGAAMTAERLAAAVELARDPSFNPISSGHRWPPIITIGDDGNRFAIGSADITDEFRGSLELSVAPQVAQLLAEFGADVIEIIGHTDEQRIAATDPSNLDAEAIKVMLGQGSSEALRPVDNAGLGLARAIAVAKVLQETGQFADSVRVIPLSAAQLLLPGDILSDGTGARNDASRRRIEIRVRRSAGQL